MTAATFALGDRVVDREGDTGTVVMIDTDYVYVDGDAATTIWRYPREATPLRQIDADEESASATP